MALALQASALDVYVAPDGSDDATGLGPDAPFATLTRARDAIRTARAAAGGALGPVTVYLRGGVHASEGRRRVRFELAGYLTLRARALEQLGKEDEAARDRKRARALTYLSGPTWHRPNGNRHEPVPLPERYVDVLATE